MAFHVRDKETDAPVRKLAHREGIGLTEAVRRAVQHELQRADKQVPVKDRIRKIQERITRYPKTDFKGTELGVGGRLSPSPRIAQG